MTTVCIMLLLKDLYFLVADFTLRTLRPFYYNGKKITFTYKLDPEVSLCLSNTFVSLVKNELLYILPVPAAVIYSLNVRYHTQYFSPNIFKEENIFLVMCRVG